jgi:hypothetical protein
MMGPHWSSNEYWTFQSESKIEAATRGSIGGVKTATGNGVAKPTEVEGEEGVDKSGTIEGGF